MLVNDNIVFTELGHSSGVRPEPLFFMALIWTHVQEYKSHSDKHTFTHGLQVYSLFFNLEVNQNGVFMLECTWSSKALESILTMPTQ